MTDTVAGSPSPVQALTRKIGPFPGYVYVLAVVGGYVAWRYYKSRQAGTGAVDTSPDAGVVDYSSDANTQTGGLTYTGSGGSSGSVTTPNGQPAITNNAVWAQQAANLLIAEGYNPLTVNTALSNYLNGKALSQQQQSLVTLALQRLGTPPEGVLPAVLAPTVPAPGAPVPQPYQPPTRVIAGGSGGTSNVPDGYYRTNPGGAEYIVRTNQRWRLTGAQVTTLEARNTVFHPITDTTMNTLKLVGYWQGALP